MSPENRSKSSRAWAGVIFRSVSAVTAIEWQVKTGTRTVVGEISRPGNSNILRVSLTSFISSAVYPSGPNRSIAGIRLKAIGCGKCLGWMVSPRAQASVCSLSSAIPLTPAPDTDW